MIDQPSTLNPVARLWMNRRLVQRNKALRALVVRDVYTKSMHCSVVRGTGESLSLELSQRLEQLGNGSSGLVALEMLEFRGTLFQLPPFEYRRSWQEAGAFLLDFRRPIAGSTVAMRVDILTAREYGSFLRLPRDVPTPLSMSDEIRDPAVPVPIACLTFATDMQDPDIELLGVAHDCGVRWSIGMPAVSCAVLPRAQIGRVEKLHGFNLFFTPGLLAASPPAFAERCCSLMAPCLEFLREFLGWIPTEAALMHLPEERVRTDVIGDGSTLCVTEDVQRSFATSADVFWLQAFMVAELSRAYWGAGIDVPEPGGVELLDALCVGTASVFVRRVHGHAAHERYRRFAEDLRRTSWVKELRSRVYSRFSLRICGALRAQLIDAWDAADPETKVRKTLEEFWGHRVSGSKLRRALSLPG